MYSRRMSGLETHQLGSLRANFRASLRGPPSRRSTRHRSSYTVKAWLNVGGFRLLEWTGAIVPQGRLVTAAKFTWRQLWLAFMRELAPQSTTGAYQRPSYTFQNCIGDVEFPVEVGRYVIYLGNPCPWCHRVAMTIALRNLEDYISTVQCIDDPERASRGGWVFNSPEPVFGAKDLREVYDSCSGPSGYRGRCTAPLLIDAKSKRIVCNESSILVRALNAPIFPLSKSDIDLYPDHLAGEIDALNELIGNSVNNGVYKCGFATSQHAYTAAETELFAALAQLEERLRGRRFLMGDRFTEADLRLLPTAARFDAVYATLFKCSRHLWRDFPGLHSWLQDCLHLPIPTGDRTLKDTIDIDDCRRSYFKQLFPLNPGGIVPGGPSAQELIEPFQPSSDGCDSIYYMHSHRTKN